MRVERDHDSPQCMKKGEARQKQRIVSTVTFINKCLPPERNNTKVGAETHEEGRKCKGTRTCSPQVDPKGESREPGSRDAGDQDRHRLITQSGPDQIASQHPATEELGGEQGRREVHSKTGLTIKSCFGASLLKPEVGSGKAHPERRQTMKGKNGPPKSLGRMA